MRLMSTSLKLVSMAALFCACFSRSAMRLRRRVICTRSSRSWGARGAAGTAGAGAGAAAALRVSRAISARAAASALISRPSLPLPWAPVMSMPDSAMILRTEGAWSSGVAGAGCTAGARGAGGGADLAQPSAGAGIDLQGHLVRLELEQRLVALDGIAHRLGPFGDGRLGHGFAEGGDDDIGCHGALES